MRTVSGISNLNHIEESIRLLEPLPITQSISLHFVGPCAPASFIEIIKEGEMPSEPIYHIRDLENNMNIIEFLSTYDHYFYMDCSTVKLYFIFNDFKIYLKKKKSIIIDRDLSLYTLKQFKMKKKNHESRL